MVSVKLPCKKAFETLPKGPLLGNSNGENSADGSGFDYRTKGFVVVDPR
jgi:hypothetical protein